MASTSASISGGNVVITPLISMVADRSGFSRRRNLRIDRPDRSWTLRDTASAVNTMVRWASIASRVRAKMGPGGEVGLGHPEGLLDVPEVVVAGDHLGGGHE